MVGVEAVITSQSSPTFNDVIVLLPIEEVIALQIVVPLFLNFVLDHERHVTVREADVIS